MRTDDLLTTELATEKLAGFQRHILERWPEVLRSLDQLTAKKRKPKPKPKKKPPVRGRASQPPLEVMGQVGQLVRWRPRHTPPEVWVLCLAVGLRFRYGNWDFQLIPVAGSGSWWAEWGYVAPYSQELSPASLLASLQSRADAHFQEPPDDDPDDPPQARLEPPAARQDHPEAGVAG